MKKYIAIPLFFVYFLAVTGVMIQQVCCNMDRQPLMVATTEMPAGHSCCSKAPVEKTTKSSLKDKNNCCKHQTVVVKTIHDQLSEKAQQLLFSFQASPALANNFVYTGIVPELPVYVSNRINAPPGIWQNIPLYKLHQRFTYYG